MNHTDPIETLEAYQPKYSDYQEKAIVGSLMLDFSLIRILRERHVTAEHFFLPSCRAVIEVMLDPANEYETQCDPISLARQLEIRGTMKDVGGEGQLHHFYTDIPRFANAEPFARWVEGVKEDARKRKLGEMAQKMLLCTQNGVTSSDIIQSFTIDSAWMLTDTPQLEEETMEDVAAAIDNEIRLRAESADSGVRVGIPYVDARLGGLQRGHLVVLAAFASQGKTTTALQMVISMLDEDVPVGVFCFEATRAEIGQKLEALKSGLSRTPFVTGRFTAEEREKYQEAYRWLSTRPLRLKDGQSMEPTIDAVEMEVRSMAHKGVRLIVIDYLGLLRVRGKISSRQEEVAQMSRRLKNLAQEVGVTILCLAQLKRDAESRRAEKDKHSGISKKQLFLSDLADSSGVERDADQVIFIATEEDDGESSWSDAKLEIKKNRHGRGGALAGQFNRKLGCFEWGY